MKLNKYIYSLALASIISLSATAQVTIGMDKKPLDGALLDLKDKESTSDDSSTASRGLGLPRVLLTQKNQLFPMFEAKNPADLSEGYKDYDKADEDKLHIGLLVYNANEVDGEINGVETPDENVLCKGLHVWNGSAWHPIVPYPNIPKSGTAPSSAKLGRVGTLVDIRKNKTTNKLEFNKYNIAGFASENAEIIEQKYVSCDEANLRPDVQIRGEYAGVWMTQNLATKIYPNGTPIDYNGSADASYGYPGAVSTAGAMKEPFYRWDKEHGLVYTWVAATNGGNSSTANQGWIVDPGEPDENPFDLVANPYRDDEVDNPATGGKQIQGVCPAGWHLPSDRELSQLIYVLRQNPSAYGIQGKVANAVGGGVDFPIPSGTPPLVSAADVGTVLKSAPALTDQADVSAGLSLSSWQGGFNLLLMGYAENGSTEGYGYYGSLWSSSADGSFAWYRYVDSGPAGVDRFNFDRNGLFSVRCKKDN